MLNDKCGYGSVSMRCTHPNMDLAFFSELLKLKCENPWKAGEKKRTPKGNSVKGIYKYSYWYTSIKYPAEECFDEHLRLMIERLANVKPELASFFDSGGKIDIYLHPSGAIHNFGVIDVNSLQIIADMNIRILIEVFPEPQYL